MLWCKRVIWVSIEVIVIAVQVSNRLCLRDSGYHENGVVIKAG